jgi:hypothetical protein
MPKINDDFLNDKLNYAIVVTGTPDDIQRLKQIISEMDIQVIFQKMSYGELLIVKGSNHDTR